MTDTAGWPDGTQIRDVEAAGLSWRVRTLGDGPSLLLLHGTGASTHSWRGLAPLLARNFALTAIDLPGHGGTKGRLSGGPTLPNVARAIAALQLDPQLIVAHSAGAAVAIRMALAGFVAPKGIVGLGAALQPFPGVAQAVFPTLAKLLFVNPFAPHVFAGVARAPGETGRFLERSTGSRIDAEGVAHYRALLGDAGHVGGALAMMANWDLTPLARDLPKLATPLLLIHGARDSAIAPDSARTNAARAPHARLEMLDGLGHLAHEERPDLVVALIEGFAEDLA